MNGDISKLKVVDLKKELQDRSLSTAGLKAELVERLQEAIAAEKESSKEDETEPEPALEPATEDKDSKDEDEDTKDAQVTKTTAREPTAASPAPQTTEAKTEEKTGQAKDEPVASDDLISTHAHADAATPQDALDGKASLSDRLDVPRAEPVSSNADTEIDIGGGIDAAADVEEPDNVASSSEEPRIEARVEQAMAPRVDGVSAHTEPPTPLNADESQQARAMTSEDASDIIKLLQPSSSVYITGLIRPLTLATLRSKAEEFGELGSDIVETSKAVWLDGIKTHAYISFKDETAATKMREALSGTVFPAETGRTIQVYYVPTDIVTRCTAFEDEAWEQRRGRVELRVRASKDDGGVLYSLHSLDAETAASPPPRASAKERPITLSVAGSAAAASSSSATRPDDEHHKKKRGVRGGRGRLRTTQFGDAPGQWPDRNGSGPSRSTGYAHGNGYGQESHSGRRADFERQSADRRRDYRGDYESAPSRSRNHGESAEERLRQLEARLAQRRERGLGGKSGSGARSPYPSHDHGRAQDYGRRDDGRDPYARPRDDRHW